MALHWAAMSAFRVAAVALSLAGGVGCGAPTPRLDAIRPEAGDAAGGATVRLEGAGFVGRGRAVVYFGMRSARAVVIEDDRLITVRTPEAEALGPTDLRLEFADGTVLARAEGYGYSSADGTLKPIPFVPGQVPVPTAEE
jgi:hypothetical protein